ncbi:OLC1v1018974C1 [Oldenlandia corymbosa var. corymbosa]|uniref:OLC1v1018974C1 n=1 Tax=Oldenlandia corymbosa var. corymbosa TaxID=529605 RepID=A0AAV1ECZ2_OLDCO|nr:OLC1v1018974C1 [Oldenlandia corymbosa var. corymbosa]
MANPGEGVGAKFVSVNLNKSYGQSSHHNHQPYGGSYGQAAGRGRPGSGGRSGGMVVLSRSRNSQKVAGPKLSVPPPLNLPSLRKEHEKFDVSTGPGPAINSTTGSGPRPSSSGMGWTKPVSIALQEKDVGDGDTKVEQSGRGVDGEVRLNSTYMPPSARSTVVGNATSVAGSARPLPNPAEKAVVLKGEDFPSLQAALPVSSVPGQKQKDTANPKQKPAISVEATDQQEGRFPSSSRVELTSRAQESYNVSRNGSIDDIGDSRRSGSSRMPSQPSKDDFFSSPLPLVPMNHRSDWADDERDTGHGFVDRATEWNPRERYASEQSSRYRAGNLQNSSISKPLLAGGGKLPLPSDSIMASGNDKRGAGKSERLLEDPFMGTSGFDDRDPFPGSLLGVIKRRKDVVKHSDWHDPARELFEAELEKVQKMQELERQWILEEQERAVEQARREEEERQRLIREEEERQRRLEEETREAAWRAEQERLEAHRKAEEQRVAREEEKRRMLMEEERRKQAAKQKLMELEERMAKRQAEAVNSETSVVTASTDEKLPTILKDNDVSATDLETWEDSEKMVERITSSTSFDTSSLNRPFETDSRAYATRESSSGFLDRRRPLNSWRRDPFENGSGASSQMQEHDMSHFSPQRDSFANVRAVGRKDFHGSSGYASSRANLRGMQEPYLDELGHQREQRWNFPGDSDSFSGGRDFDAEFQGNLTERYGDVGWGQNHFRGNAYPPYPERPYANSEADELYPYGRSRYSMRQPRVLPPPIASTQRTPFRIANERSGPSGFLPDNNHVNHAQRTESTRPTGYYSGHQDGVEQPGVVDMPQESVGVEDQKLEKEMTTRCDSQSSLSVSSPPSSPPHLSYDELDDSGDSPILSASAAGKHISMSGNDAVILNDNSVQHTTVADSGMISNIEDEEWTLENADGLQEQEEYNEEDDGYQEEDEVREGDYDNLDLNQDFGDLHLEDKCSSGMVDNMVLGFDEGIKVELPNDDFDRNFRNEDKSVVCAQSDEHSHEQEMEKDIPDSVKTPDNLYSSITSDGPPFSSQQTLASSAGLPSFTSLTTASTASTTPNQVDTPVQLQFGLFSGPPLIPSPVPTIQIGSIQMPLHLHPSTGPSFVHPSQSPIFQFGQVRYTSSPISLGVLPIAPPSTTSSFGQPTVQTSYSLNLNAGGALPTQPSQDTSTQSVVNGDSSSQCNRSLAESSVAARQSADSSSQTQIITTKVASGSGEKLKSETVGQGETKWHNEPLSRSRAPSKGRMSGNQLQSRLSINDSISNEKNFGVVKASGAVSKGKRYTYAVKNSGARSALSIDDESSLQTNGFQRRSRRTVQRVEFRVRENGERRPPSGSFSSNSLNAHDKYDNNGRSGTQFVRSGSKRGTMSSKSVKQISDAEGSNFVGKEIQKDVSIRDQKVSQAGERNVKRNISEEDVDAPLQSGVVRVFKQPGIEAPSDEDDFIEVRSKRQMLNDRREQREKEIKAKTRPSRKPYTSRPISGGLNNSKKASVSARASPPNINSGFSSSEGRVLAYKERSAPKVSQPLAPIGTPAVKFDTQTDKRSQSIKSLPASSASVLSGGDKDHGPNLTFESQSKVMDNVSSSLNSWGNSQFNQQVMALTQTQLEEAMEAPRFDSSITSVGGHSSGPTEPILPSSSLLIKERSFTSSSPINSLLAGEKIQFGAVTSPPILPPSSRAPGSSRPEIQIPHNLSVAEDECSLFFKKDKHTDDSCAHLQDSDAEAAASAVAVAAIASDEVVENGIGSISISESKSFGGADIDNIAAGMGDHQLVSQSKAEESLSVSLPADLSVDTPPISLWPPLPSPHNSSNQMLSHFPGGRPHFPFYEMNPMLGGPIFAFTPSEGSVGAQSQTQKSVTTSTSGPLGTWQHSAVDSFYGHPAGYTGPFISPPGGIPGVQGPPHMVVYNHFAPVGQFGQVGLSFMGPTYIPSGKPSDGKHNSSSAVGMGEGHLNNPNIASGQRNHPNIPAPIQHLTSGSPIMPFASPLAMFDVSPFQSAPDISVQAHWSHVPAPALHSVPFSRPLQQAEGILPPLLGHVNPADQSLNVSRFPESRTSTPSTTGPSFTVQPEVNVAHLPDELGLVDTSRSTTAAASSQNTVGHSSSTSSTTDANNTGNLSTGGNTNNEGHGSGGFKNRSSQQKNMSAHQTHSPGYNYQRVGSGTSHRNNAGGEWSHRRINFHGRNQSFGSEKGMSSSKMKQIYVAKQPTNGSSG